MKTRHSFLIGERPVQLDLDDAQPSQHLMGDYLSSGLYYEGETVAALEQSLKAGDTFIDVGAHVGYFSVIGAALVGPGGVVMAFEPNADNYRALKENLKLNGFANVRPMFAAVGARDGQGEIYLNADNDGGHALWDAGKHPANVRSKARPVKLDVQLMALDNWIEPGARVGAIKIDTEGAEMEVLKGARRLLNWFPQATVIAEVNHFGLNEMGTSAESMRALMEDELGYTAYLLAPNSTGPVKWGRVDNYESPVVFGMMWRKT